MSVLTRFYVKKKKKQPFGFSLGYESPKTGLSSQRNEKYCFFFFFPKLKLLFLNNHTNSQVTEDRGAELIGVHCRLQLLIILVM